MRGIVTRVLAPGDRRSIQVETKEADKVGRTVHYGLFCLRLFLQ